jgi:ribosomal protein S18 acetylase RimI-like enzyme
MELPGEFAVRRAAEDDLDAVARVWRESALAMDGRADVPPVEALRQRVETGLRSGWDLHVGTRGQRIVGMLALKPAEATLDQIFVLPTEQGKGIGAALMAVARSEMPAGFSLRMAASNEQARRFYEKQGLERIGGGLHPWTGIPVHFYGWNVS